MKKYTNYKQTGIDWIGEIPEHWELKKVKYVADFLNGNAFDSKNYVNDSKNTVPLIRIGDIDKNINLEEAKKLPADYSSLYSNFIIKKNDILLALSGATTGKNCLFKIDEVCLLNQRVAILRTRKLSQEFLHYILNSELKTKILTDAYGGAQPNISKENVVNFSISMPSSEEQKKVVSYLKFKTTLIDNLISKNNQLIQLLEEKKQATINQAVTKGLNPNVKMKDSGIEWIGEIPEHWGRSKIKRIVATKVCDGPHETPVFIENGVPFVSANAVRNQLIDFENKRGFISDELYQEYSKKSLVKKNDILFVKSGSTTGKSALVTTNEKFAIWSPLAIVRANQKIIDYKFLLYVINSEYFFTQVKNNWSFGTQPNIGMESLENLWSTIPPLDEQNEIVKTLENISIKTNITVNKLYKQNLLFQEYRQALISNAVTGKIDVRDEPIPAEFIKDQTI